MFCLFFFLNIIITGFYSPLEIEFQTKQIIFKKRYIAELKRLSQKLAKSPTDGNVLKGLGFFFLIFFFSKLKIPLR